MISDVALTIFIIAIAAILHYWWHKAGKNDFGTVSIYAGIVVWLLGIRLWWAWQDRRRRIKRNRNAAAATGSPVA